MRGLFFSCSQQLLQRQNGNNGIRCCAWKLQASSSPVGPGYFARVCLRSLPSHKSLVLLLLLVVKWFWMLEISSGLALPESWKHLDLGWEGTSGPAQGGETWTAPRSALGQAEQCFWSIPQTQQAAFPPSLFLSSQRQNYIAIIQKISTSDFSPNTGWVETAQPVKELQLKPPNQKPECRWGEISQLACQCSYQDRKGRLLLSPVRRIKAAPSSVLAVANQ